MIHICFNLDEKYKMPCKVLMKQIDALTSDEVTYHLIGIKADDMDTKNTCKFYPKPDLSYFQADNLTDYYYFSQAAMYRLLIPFLIQTDRAIYMDIDMLVMQDLKKLWDKKVDLVGAVIDPCDIFHGKRLKLKTPKYYNSGLILFESKKIREQMPDYKDRVLQAQKDYVLDLKDQDIFNIVFKDHITTLGYEFNIDAHNLKEKTETKKTSALKDKAYENPVIVHCMGKRKWWNYGGLPFGEYWDKFAGDKYTPKYRPAIIKRGNITIIRN